MVPKPQPDGSASSSADKMQPITVLSTLLRITSRILNARIIRILLNNPGILDPSQRAFIKNGGIEQCIDLMLDTFEDALEAKKDLASCKYDQVKAYDSVQMYSVRAALRSLDFPEEFIQYVESGMVGARSRVKTAHGYTAWVRLWSGLRQGDPLSLVLYNLVIDGLARGLRTRPNWGYKFSNGNVRLTHCQFADDVHVLDDRARRMVDADPRVMEWARKAAICTHVRSVDCACPNRDYTRSTINAMHGWICEFFGAHNWDFKPAKSEYQVVFRTDPTDAEGAPRKAEALPALSGNPRDAIRPTDPEKAGRYLGFPDT